jgi:hypothetical protein
MGMLLCKRINKIATAIWPNNCFLHWDLTRGNNPFHSVISVLSITHKIIVGLWFAHQTCASSFKQLTNLDGSRWWIFTKIFTQNYVVIFHSQNGLAVSSSDYGKLLPWMVLTSCETDGRVRRSRRETVTYERDSSMRKSSWGMRETPRDVLCGQKRNIVWIVLSASCLELILPGLHVLVFNDENIRIVSTPVSFREPGSKPLLTENLDL